MLKLKKVRVHNLKDVDLELEPNQLIVFTGVSGSGKSSLAFDTIYTEGQRRYIESLSTYARRQLGDLPKPDADLIEGLSPTIAIEQKTSGRTPRSTVGTMTGVYDYMRVLYARVGEAHCPISGERVMPMSTPEIIEQIISRKDGTKLIILSPYAKNKKGEFKDDFAELLRRGFTRVRLDGKVIEITDDLKIDKQVAHDVDVIIDRLVLPDLERVKEAVSKALDIGKGVMSILDGEEETLFSQHAYAKKSGQSYRPLEPHDFSFNHPLGMCPTCQGLGTLRTFVLEKIINPDLSIEEDCCSVAPSYKTVRYGNIYDNLGEQFGFSVTTPWKKLTEKAREIYLYGTKEKWMRMTFFHPTKRSRWVDYVQWRGVLFEAMKRYSEATSDFYRSHMHELMAESICPDCHGARIRAYPAATQLQGKKIHEVTTLSIADALAFFQSIKSNKISEELLKEIILRLTFLMGVGLHYLTLERISPTLSGGEAQRVRLASQIGSGLVATTYILDEPSIGLHPRDNTQLLATLRRLQQKGNTVIVVEHDEETMLAADHIVDVGPLAGQHGGEILVSGSVADLLACDRSMTGAYLSGKLQIPLPKKRRKPTKAALKIEGATHHNLKKVSVKIPLGVFIAVTGVSGSGKSSLITDILYPALSNALHSAQLPVGAHKSISGIDHVDKVIAIDQTPIGRTPRSNPATYIKVWDDIRGLFTELPESKAQGFKAGRFSFNVKEGSCPHCEGMGMVRIDMDFLEDEWTPCTHCKGKRFDTKTLAVLYRGKNIHDILEMPVAEALIFFGAIPHIHKKLETLAKVGLDYLCLGQSSPTLSGGEAQRIKLAKELARPSTGKTVYILDEPTTGLHFHDIHKLVSVLQALVDKGNTVIVIEHNMDLVKTADWILEMGPEGGDAGGKMIAEGSPEKIIAGKTATADALRPKLEHTPLNVSPKKIASSTATKEIVVREAAQNNLQNVSAHIPRGKITVCTGPSGSGKTSFAFETIYAEGQRRYVESLSPYARQFVKQMPKPKVEEITGLSPAIAIEQKSHAGNPRSTVGTMTEGYDFLRILYAYLGTPHAPDTKEPLQTISKEYVVEKLLQLPEGSRLHILAPQDLRRDEAFSDLCQRLQRQGFLRIRLNGTYYELDQEIPFDKGRKNTLFLVIDRCTVSPDHRKRLFDALDHANSDSIVIDCEGKDLFFHFAFTDPTTGKSYPAITPHTFSFNTESGMCPDCLGLGFQYGIDLTRHPDILKQSVASIMRLLWKEYFSREGWSLFLACMDKAGIDPYLPLKQLSSDQLQKIFHGTIAYKQFTWRGIYPVLSHAVKASSEMRDILEPLLDQTSCLSCAGSRLKPLARHVLIHKKSIADFCRLSIEEALGFLSKLTIPPFLQEAFRQLQSRLFFLQQIGLGYLSMDRSAPTLSGGETQRIRLSRQLGGGLTGCLYVLDEPTIGLHPHDNTLLNHALAQLRDLGNTLILVEHDPLTIAMADHILDFGPKAGVHGGRITAEGSLQQILDSPDSLTGAYLSGRKKIPLPEKRRKPTEFFTLKDCTLHNLKNITVDFPLKAFTCLTGVSGSGKSSLLTLLQKASLPFDKIIALEQNPLGQTNRADTSTYVDLSSPLRQLFASLPAAQIRGLQPKHFSQNHRKGMCPTCWGHGTQSISLQFLPPVKVPCSACHGYRLNPLSLTIQYKGKNLGEILSLTVLEARSFLDAIPKAVKILDTLISVGLDYLKLSQEIATLSGGEQQRIRLSRELAKRPKGKTLYLLDEPTVGLHSDDIARLLPIFQSLVARGSTLIVIEHNLDVITACDHIIDLGPGAGVHGGTIVAAGPPEQIAKNPRSITGKYFPAELRGI
ncbi:MAG: excinuclease ABC subunit UvrA [Verrucomicrobia bacterium]|nr:excinuclease ABC subunit UvrA [Verrucomicrobiota bacterium]